jgi:FkbM family methyltransferase
MPETFLTYAQNCEDVVLWRALRHIDAGTFVDVGSADPINDSVSYAFYERGWRGVHVEPVPAHAAALRTMRPEDRVFELAAASTDGRMDLHVTDDTGLSTVVADLAARTAANGFEVSTVSVKTKTLDSILSDTGLAGRGIHFLKIDVEGFEAEVLAGLDLTRWRPWVLVIEATLPQSTELSYEAWDGGVVAAGYEFTLFDGLNRFYVAKEHLELVSLLSYPACVFDQPYMRADVAARTAAAEKRGDVLKAKLAAARHDASTWRTVALRGIDEVAGLGHQLEKLRHEVDDRDRHIAALQGSLSWRVTRPLRVVRRLGHHDTESGTPMGPVAAAPAQRPSALEVDDTTRWLTKRLTTATELVGGERLGPGETVGEALQAFEEAVERSPERGDALAWLSFVTVMARYPTEVQFDRAARVLRAEGVGSLSRRLRDDLQQIAIAGAPVDRELVVAESPVLAEVGHSVTYDVHTGIQRVVRETVGRWLGTHSLALCAFDYDGYHASLLASSEAERLVGWKDHMHASGAASEARQPSWRSRAVLVPWHSTLLLPELVAEPQRCDAYRALARSGVIDRLGVVGFDTIPITAFETVADGMSGAFANFLALMKYASAVSAISESSANEFASFARMLSSQGLPGPDVAAHVLPAERPIVTDQDIERTRGSLSLDSLPLVLVVGSHEPRKNHLRVLEAAGRLWEAGQHFHLLLIGGSGWRGEEFDTYVEELRARGRPIQVRRRPSEGELWAAYHLAQFTVFPSLVEGYGLPIAESLVCGTPVITSDYGSMIEVARGGGTITIDPRDVDALVEAMARLLEDDVVLRQLEEEAAARSWGSWDNYAAEVWRHLVRGDGSAS